MRIITLIILCLALIFNSGCIGTAILIGVAIKKKKDRARAASEIQKEEYPEEIVMEDKNVE